MDPFSGLPLTNQQARALGSFFLGEQKNKSRIGYYYHPDIACYQYGNQHPMKPLRIKITDTLVTQYNLKQKMFPLLPKKAYYDLSNMVKKYDIDPTVFHSDQYIDFLRQASTLNIDIDHLQEHHDQHSTCSQGSYSSRLSSSRSLSEISCTSILSQTRFPIDKLINSGNQQEKVKDLIDEDYTKSNNGGVVGRNTRSSNQENYQEMNFPGQQSKIRPKASNSRKDIYDQIQYLKPPSAYMAVQKLDQQDNMVRFNIGQDCPIFEGLYDFCMLYSSGSIFGARQLNSQDADIVINWSGGLHHAKKNEASGFCYLNDCVLGILQLLKQYERVLYLDIDIHHGDGVEEAFYTNDRVLTCSLHKFGEYFPGTGCIKDTGILNGQNYSINFPLNEGIDDDSYRQIFNPLIDQIFAQYKPQAVVMQCGADSVSGDRLGCFNISVRGHGMCVKHLKQKGVPMMLLGGGGYTLRNVPRCWAYETGVALDVDIQNDIPQNEFSGYFAPNNQIHQSVSNMENMNSKQYLHDSLSGLFSVLKHVHPVSVTKSPGGYYQYYGEDDDDDDSDSNDDQSPSDKRRKKKKKNIDHNYDFDDDDDDEYKNNDDDQNIEDGDDQIENFQRGGNSVMKEDEMDLVEEKLGFNK